MKLVVNKQVSVSDTHPAIYTLKLNVTEAEGVTPNIFVVRYTPASKYTGPESYVFWNVAYADELLTVPDTPVNKRQACEIRRSCFVYKCGDVDTLNDFVATVTTDIQRLLHSLEEHPAIACSNLAITSETAIELPCGTEQESDPLLQSQETPAATISLSFSGE